MGDKGVAINSGCCSGRSDLKIDLKKVLQNGKKECKGTDRSYNDANSGKINLAGEAKDSGAFSGASKKSDGALNEGNKGSSQTSTDSKVIGTRQSFNLGIPLGSEPSTDKFLGVKEKKRNDTDNLWGKDIHGTQGSFNAIDGSKIDAEGATINSGCGAGINDKVIKEKIKNNENQFKDYECWGTEKSFNAKGPGKEINIKDAKLNTGAFAGIGASPRSS